MTLLDVSIYIYYIYTHIYILYIYVYMLVHIIYYITYIYILDRCCVQKKCRNPKRRFCFWRSPEVLTQDIQTYSKMTLPKKSVCEGFGTMAHHPYASLTKRWSQYPEQYKTPFLHGLCKSMNSKHSGKEKICHGFGTLRRNVGKLRLNVGKLRRNVWELRRQHLMIFSLGSMTSCQFKCTSFPLSPNVVHTYQWKWHSPKKITMSLLELRRSMGKIAFWHKSAVIAFLDIIYWYMIQYILPTCIS
jgi:hypothetical protein